MDSLAEYAISVGGKSRKVRLLQVNQRNHATMELDGKTVRIAFPKNFEFEKPVLISINGKNHKVKLKKNDRALAFDVEVDGKRFDLRVEAERRELLNKATTFSIISQPQILKREKIVVKKKGAVTSLMPGKVVLLRVKAGDKVEVGDPLCVLEAMKMENEIMAPRNGTISQVMVEQGSVVDKGDVLVVIE
jgi:biotin carboxyl carrier protein